LIDSRASTGDSGSFAWPMGLASLRMLASLRLFRPAAG
jgi:hypothetical protein